MLWNFDVKLLIKLPVVIQTFPSPMQHFPPVGGFSECPTHWGVQYVSQGPSLWGNNSLLIRLKPHPRKYLPRTLFRGKNCCFLWWYCLKSPLWAKYWQPSDSSSRHSCIYSKISTIKRVPGRSCWHLLERPKLYLHRDNSCITVYMLCPEHDIINRMLVLQLGTNEVRWS